MKPFGQVRAGAAEAGRDPSPAGVAVLAAAYGGSDNPELGEVISHAGGYVPNMLVSNYRLASLAADRLLSRRRAERGRQMDRSRLTAAGTDLLGDITADRVVAAGIHWQKGIVSPEDGIGPCEVPPARTAEAIHGVLRALPDQTTARAHSAAAIDSPDSKMHSVI